MFDSIYRTHINSGCWTNIMNIEHRIIQIRNGGRDIIRLIWEPHTFFIVLWPHRAEVNSYNRLINTSAHTHTHEQCTESTMGKAGASETNNKVAFSKVNIFLVELMRLDRNRDLILVPTCLHMPVAWFVVKLRSRVCKLVIPLLLWQFGSFSQRLEPIKFSFPYVCLSLCVCRKMK